MAAACACPIAQAKCVAIVTVAGDAATARVPAGRPAATVAAVVRRTRSVVVASAVPAPITVVAEPAVAPSVVALNAAAARARGVVDLFAAPTTRPVVAAGAVTRARPASPVYAVELDRCPLKRNASRQRRTAVSAALVGGV